MKQRVITAVVLLALLAVVVWQINTPVLVLVIALILAFWVVLPLLVVGLFCECRYHFEGIGDINVNLNSACDKMADSVDNLKSDVNNK